MPFVAQKRLEDLVNPAAIPKAGRWIVADAGDALVRQTQLRTPIYTGPPRQGERRPGTGRESVFRTPVKRHSSVLGRGWEVRAQTEDPVFPYIEWDTIPHRIAPTRERIAAYEAEHDAWVAGGRRGPAPRRPTLSFVWHGELVHLAHVNHPGTTGQHPFARAAVIVERDLPTIAGPAMREFAHDLVNGRPGSVTDRTGRGAARHDNQQATLAWARAHTTRFQLPPGRRR